MKFKKGYQRLLALIFVSFLLFSSFIQGSFLLSENGLGESGSLTIQEKEIVNSVYISLKKPEENNKTAWERDFVQEKKCVVAEVFTATWCPPCAKAHEAFEELVDENEYYSRDRFNVVFYHPYPDSKGEDPFGEPGAQARIDALYGFDSFPSAVFNGVVEEVGADENVIERYVNHIQSFLSKESVVVFKGKVSVEEREVNLSVTIKPSTNFYPARFKLVGVIVEDHLYFEGSNGVTHHRNVVRKILVEKEFQLKEKETNFSYQFSLNKDWNMSNSAVVLLVQSPERQVFGENGSKEDEKTSYFLPLIGLIVAASAALLLSVLLIKEERGRRRLINKLIDEKKERKEKAGLVCSFCRKEFLTREELKIHIKEEHFVKCPVCGVQLKKSNLQSHLKKVHK